MSGLVPNLYSVKVTDPNTGCMNSSSVLVSDSSNIQVTLNNPQNSVCRNGPNIALLATPNTGTWSGPGVTGSGFNPATANAGINILVYNLSQSGCNYLKTDTITVLGIPQVSAGTDRNICVSEANFPLIGLPAGGSWSGTCISNSGLLTVPSGETLCNVVYQFTSANNCTASDTAKVFFRALPEVPQISVTGDQLSVGLISGATYKWFLDGQLIPSADLNVLTASGSGSYSVQIISQFGCSITSLPILFTGSFSPFEMQSEIELFPNPSDGQTFYIKSDSKDQIVNIKLISTLGQVLDVSFTSIENGLIKIERNKIPFGTYFVISRFGNGKTVYKRLILK